MKQNLNQLNYIFSTYSQTNKKTPRGVDSSSFKGIFTKINFFFKEITKNDAFHPKLNFMQKE